MAFQRALAVTAAGTSKTMTVCFVVSGVAFRSEVMKSFLGVAVAEAGIWKQLGHCFFLSVI